MTIGVLLPSDPVESASIRRGVELAIAQNSTPSRKVRAVMRERGSQWGADGQEAAEMVLDDGAQGIIAPSDGAATHLALQVAGRTGTPVVSLCPDSSVTGAGIPWSLSMAPGTREQALTLFTNANAGRWLALVPDTRSGREAAKDLRYAADAARKNLSIIVAASIDLAAHAALTNSADAVFVWFSNASQIRKAAQCLRADGFHGLIAVPCTFDRVAPGLTAAVPVLEGSAWAAFTSRFAHRYGAAPDLAAALAFDAASLLLNVLPASSDSATAGSFQQRAALLNHAGASGRLQFDRHGNRTIALRVTQNNP